MENLKINEINKYDDNINLHIHGKGVLIFKDENGNIIYKTNNMIVDGGRSLIFNSFKGTSININNLKPIVGYDSTNKTVTADEKYTDISGTKLSDSNDGLIIEIADAIPNDTDYTYTFKITVNNNNSNKISGNMFNWIGLLYNETTLFSRSLFNTIIVPPSRTIEISYILHF